MSFPSSFYKHLVPRSQPIINSSANNSSVVFPPMPAIAHVPQLPGRYDHLLRRLPVSSKPTVDPVKEEMFQALEDNIKSAPANTFDIDFSRVPNPDEAEVDGDAAPFDLDHVKSFHSQKHFSLSEEDWKYLKDSFWRDEYLAALGVGPNNSDWRRQVVWLAFMSVGPSTFRSYASHWKKLKENNCTLDYEGLMKYYASHRTEISTDSLNSWESAVTLYTRAFGKEGARVLLKLVSNGYAHDNPNGLAKERGVIDRHKIQELQRHPSISNTIYADGLALQFATGVRGGQVSSMKHSDFSRITDRRTQKTVGFLFTCAKHKDKGKHRRNAFETHICDRSYNDLIEKMLAAAADRRDQRLVPDWKQAEANSLVKSVAKDLEWDEDFVWVNHGVRHGACQDAAEGAEDSDEQVELAHGRTCQTSKTVIENTYLRPAAVRKKAVQASKKRQQTGVPSSTPAQTEAVQLSKKQTSQLQNKRMKKAKKEEPARDPVTGKKKKPAALKRTPLAVGSAVKKLKQNPNLKIVGLKK
jgi:hypothetical protein